MNLTNLALLPYRVGALMYTPASNETIAPKICSGKIPYLDSLVFCLEDAINCFGVELAEKQLHKTISYLACKNKQPNIPLIFITQV